jgi:hypothetical protein
MIKKIIFLILILSLANCGYQPIFVKNSTNKFLIQEYELIGDKTVNRKIISQLNLKKNPNKKSGYVLALSSFKKIEIAAKDKTGNASKFNTNITVNIKISKNNNLIKEKSFSENYNYSNSENKFDLLQYQKNIDNNLIEKITEEIILFLNT